MSHLPYLDLGTGKRRDADRVAVDFFLNEYVAERMHRAYSTNLSSTGLFVHRVFDAGRRHLQFGREERFVQLEFDLPGTGEIIWARGEVRYDEIGFGRAQVAAGPQAMVHGTGIYFSDMARKHQRLLRDFVRDRKINRLKQILTLIRRNRYH
jgi:hypothetical protein